MNNRVIILEGPDCAGKSMLSQYLEQEHYFTSWHTTKPVEGEDVFKTYTHSLVKALEHDQPVVFDRLHIGEAIYGPIMRGEDLLGEGLKLLNRVIAARGVKVIICLPEFQHFKKSFEERGDAYVEKFATAQKIYNRYETYARQFGTKVYDYVHDSSGDRDDMLFTPAPSLPLGCTGYSRAQWLVVGETVNHNVLDYDLPFHDLRNGSGFLNESLRLTKLAERNFAFTNAYPLADPEPRDLTRIVKRMPLFKRAIALGRRAERVCEAQGIPCKYVEHPACHKRFKHKFDEYSAALKEATK